MTNIESKEGKVLGHEFDDTYTGKGYCSRDDGSIYEGEWVKGRMHGAGILRKKDGQVLEGIFINGNYVGKIDIIDNENIKPIKNLEDIKNSIIRIRYVNGDVYKGTWSHSGKNGYGTLKHKNKPPETGFFVNDVCIGKLYERKKDGSLKEIDYSNCEYEGEVHIEFKNGDIYDGHWKNGYPQGYGEYTNFIKIGKNCLQSDKEIYKGTWKKGLRDGERDCNQEYADGRIYNGGFKDDKWDGYGELIDNRGNYYKGQFSKGKKHGQGLIKFMDGVYCYGKWADNKKTGLFKYKFKNQGEIFSYYSNNNEPEESVFIDALGGYVFFCKKNDKIIVQFDPIMTIPEIKTCVNEQIIKNRSGETIFNLAIILAEQIIFHVTQNQLQDLIFKAKQEGSISANRSESHLIVNNTSRFAMFEDDITDPNRGRPMIDHWTFWS